LNYDSKIDPTKGTWQCKVVWLE